MCLALQQVHSLLQNITLFKTDKKKKEKKHTFQSSGTVLIFCVTYSALIQLSLIQLCIGTLYLQFDANSTYTRNYKLFKTSLLFHNFE